MDPSIPVNVALKTGKDHRSQVLALCHLWKVLQLALSFPSLLFFYTELVVFGIQMLER